MHPGAGAIAGPLRARGAAALADLRRQPARRPCACSPGDSEGLPGVNVDRYGDFVVVQWLSAGALPWRDELFDAIEKSATPPASTSSAACAHSAARRRPSRPCARVAQEAPLEVVVEEAGCRFGVDVTAPLGVGFYPDLRGGRDVVAARAADRRVLNLFSYTGAFSVRAAKAGAREVVSVDSVAKVHARARRNLELTGHRSGAGRGDHRRRGQDAGQVRLAGPPLRSRDLRSRRPSRTPRARARRSR